MTPEISPRLSKAKFSLSYKMSIMCHTDGSESQSDGFIALRFSRFDDRSASQCLRIKQLILTTEEDHM